MAWEEITFKISADMDFGNAISQVNAVKEGVNSLKQSFVDMPNFTGILDSSLEKTTTVADALGSKLEKLQDKELSAKERNRTEKGAESNVEELNVLRQLQGGNSSYSLSMAHSFLSGLPAAMRSEFDAITPQISALIRSRMSTFSKELQFKSTSASGIAAEIMTAASKGKDKELSSLIKQGIHSSEGLYQFQDYLEYLIPHVVPQNRLSSYQMKRYGKTLSNSAGAFDRGEPIDLFPESYKTSYKSEGYRSSRLTKEEKAQIMSSDYRTILDDLLKQNPVAVKAALSSGISRRDNRGILETREEITREQWENFRSALYDELVTRVSGYAASKVNPYSTVKKDKETIAERLTQSTSGKAMMAMHEIEAMQDKGAWTAGTGNEYYRKNHKEAKRLLDQYVVNKYSPFSLDPNFEKPTQVMISESQATRVLGNGRYKNNDDISGDVVIVSMAGYDKTNPEHIARRDKIDKEGLTVNERKYVLDSIHGKDDDTIYRMISEQAKDDANRRQESWAREAGFSGTYFGNFADKQVEALRASGKLDETTYGKYAESKNKKWTPSYDIGVNPDNIRIAVVNMKGKDGVEYGDGGLWVSNMLMRDSSQSRIGVGGKGSNFVFTGENVGKAFEKWGALDSQGRAMVNAPGGEQYDASDATILLPISVLKNKLAYQNEDGTWKSAEEINRMVTAEAKNLGLSAVVNYDTEDTRSDHLGAQTTSFLNFSPKVRQHQIDLALKRMRELDTEEGQLKYVFGNNEDWFDEKVNNDHSLLGTVQARRRIDNYRQKLMQSLVAGQFIDFGEGDDKFANIRAAANPLSSYLLSHYGGVTPEVIKKARGYLKKQGIDDQYTDEDIENLINLKHGTAIDFAHEDKENLTLLRSPMGYGNILPVKNLAKKARPLYEAFGISTTAGAYASEEDRDVLQGFDYDADQFKVVLDQALAKEIEEISKKQEYKKRELETKSSDKVITDLSEGNKGITERKIEQGLGMGTGSAGTRAMQIDLTDPKNRRYIVGAQEMQYLYDKASTNDKNPQLVDLNGSRVWDVLKLGQEYTKFADHANELFKYDEDQLDENGLPDEGRLKKLDLYKASNGQIVNLRALRRMGIDDINAPSVNMASHMMSVGFANRLFREGLSNTTRWDAISEAMDQLDYGNAGVARKNLMQTMRHMLPEWASGRRARLTSEEDNALEKLIDAAIVELKNEAEEQKETAFNKDTGKWELGNASYKTAQAFVDAYVENNKKLYGIRTAENLRTQFGLTEQRGEQYLGDYFDQSFINSGTRNLVGDIEATRRAQREEMIRQLEALEKEEAENAKQDVASQNDIKKNENKKKQKHENKPRFGPGASNIDNTPLAGPGKQDVVPNEKAASMTSEPQNEIDLLKKRIADFDNETKHRVDFQAKYNQTLSEAREASNQLLISRLGNENKINGNTSYAKSYWNRQFYGIAKPQLDLLEEMGAEIDSDSSFTTDEKSSFRAAIKQQQTEIQRNVNKDFVAKAIAYSQQVADEINEEVEKTDKKPSAQKNKLNALDEKINNSKSFEDFIVKRMNDKNSIFNQEEQELFGSGLKNVRNNLANQLRERERLVDLYTKENEENALISMESLEGKLGKRDKNSLAVKYEDRLRSIQDQQEKFDKQHNERLMSDNFYKQQTAKLNAYKDSALEDLIKEERLKLGIDKASPKEIADKWYQDRIETINASKQLRVDTARKAWMNGTGTYDDYVEAQKALYFGPNEEEKRLLAQRDNIEKSIEQKDSEQRYRSVTEANRLADIVEQANGIGRFAKNIGKNNLPKPIMTENKISNVVDQVRSSALNTQIESEKAIQNVSDEIKQIEPPAKNEQIEKEHATKKAELQEKQRSELESYNAEKENIEKRRLEENNRYENQKQLLLSNNPEQVFQDRLKSINEEEQRLLDTTPEIQHNDEVFDQKINDAKTKIESTAREASLEARKSTDQQLYEEEKQDTKTRATQILNDKFSGKQDEAKAQGIDLDEVKRIAKSVDQMSPDEFRDFINPQNIRKSNRALREAKEYLSPEAYEEFKQEELAKGSLAKMHVQNAFLRSYSGVLKEKYGEDEFNTPEQLRERIVRDAENKVYNSAIEEETQKTISDIEKERAESKVAAGKSRVDRAAIQEDASRQRQEAEAEFQKAVSSKPDVAQIDKEHEDILKQINEDEKKIDDKHQQSLAGFKQEEKSIQQSAEQSQQSVQTDISAETQKVADEAIKAAGEAVKSVKVDKPKVDESGISDAAEKAAKQATEAAAESIKSSESGGNTSQPLAEEPNIPTGNFTSEEYKAAARSYEASAKTAQVAQGIRDQITTLSQIENPTAYEAATLERLKAINPDTLQGKAYLENVQKDFEQQAQAQEQYKQQTQADALTAIQENGQLALARQEASYDQYHNQRRMHGVRSRAASFYMQDYNRHQQLGLQKQGLENNINQRQREIDRLQGLADSSTGKDKENYQNQIAQKTENLTQLKDQLKSVNKEYNDFNEKTAAGDAAMSAFGQSVGMVARRFATQTFRKILNETKQFIKQFDKAMTEIQMITLKSDTQISDLGSKLIDVAKNTGSTVTDVTSAASNLYRQGLSDEEVNERLDDVIKFSKVSGIKTTEASKIITTALQNGLVGNSTEAMDALVALGDSAATTASEIAKGMQKSAAAAKQSGMSYGELVTLLTIGTSKTQLGGSTIGSSLNTLMYRLYKVNNGEDFYDENGNHVSSTAASNALRQMGISLYDEEGNFRGPYQILQDIATNWENADDTTQSMILTTLGAGRQRSNIATLLQGMAEDNGEIAQKYLDTAEGSKGITDRKYEEYLDSLEAKTNTLKSSWDELVSGFSGGEIAKGGIDFITGLVQSFTAFNEALGGTPGLLMGVAAAIAVVSALVKTSIFTSPVFLAALPALAAVAGIAVTALGVGAIINSNNNQPTEEERREKRITNATEARSTFLQYRTSKTNEYESHIKELNNLIKDREENPEKWTEEKAKSFDKHMSALSDAFPEIAGSAINASSSLESMKNAVNGATSALDEYKGKTLEQVKALTQNIIYEEQQKKAEEKRKIEEKYDNFEQPVEFNGMSFDAGESLVNKAVSKESARRMKAKAITSKNVVVGPHITQALEAISNGNMSEDQWINDNWATTLIAGKTFNTIDDFLNWAYNDGTWTDKYGEHNANIEFKPPEYNGSIIKDEDNIAKDFYTFYNRGDATFKDDKWYNKTFTPILSAMYKAGAFSSEILGKNSPIAIALQGLYGGDITAFEKDARTGFTKMYEQYGDSASGILSNLFGSVKDFQSGELKVGETPLIEKIKTDKEAELAAVDDKTIDMILDNAAIVYGFDDTTKSVLRSYLTQNNFNPNLPNPLDEVEKVLTKRNEDTAAFDTKYAPEGTLPIRYVNADGTVLKYRTIDDAIEDQMTRHLGKDYDESSESAKILRKTIRKSLIDENQQTAGNIVYNAAMTAQTSKDSKIQTAERTYESLTEAINEEGIKNLKQLFDAVDEGAIDSFDSLLKAFPELAEMLNDFIEQDTEGNYKLKEGVENDETSLSILLDSLASLTEKYKNNTYQTRAQTYEYASLYANETGETRTYRNNKTYQNAYKEVVGSDLGAKVLDETQTLNDVEELARGLLLQNYGNNIVGFTEDDKLALAQQMFAHIGTGDFTSTYLNSANEVRTALEGLVSQDYLNAAAALEQANNGQGISVNRTRVTMKNLSDYRDVAEVNEVLNASGTTFEEAVQSVDDYQRAFEALVAKALKPFGKSTDEVNTKTAKFRGTLKEQNEAIKSYRSSMNSILNNQAMRQAFRSGKSMPGLSDYIESLGFTKKDANDAKMKDKILEAMNLDEAVDEAMSSEEIGAAFGVMDEKFNDYVNANPITVDGLTVNVEEGHLNLSTEELLSNFGDALSETQQALIQDALARGVKIQWNVDWAGNQTTITPVVSDLGEGKRTGGGGGGGGKSAVDKLLEKQKHRMAELEHQNKMLQTEEKTYDYRNDYSGWNDNIQDQINLQYQLSEAYKLNIKEMENLLARTKKGSDDWYKLKESIYSAEEAMKETINTINELNAKKINILADQFEESDKKGTHKINMLDKYAQRAMDEDRYNDYIRFTNQKITETQAQRSANNTEIAKWKEQLAQYEKDSDSWREIRDKIWALEEENADLDNQVVQMQLELGQQKLSQIAKVVQQNTQTATHNQNLASTFASVYESQGYRKNYEEMIVEQMKTNEVLIAENEKAKKSVQDQMKTLKEGSTAWFEAQAALYQYDEAVAQAQVSQMEFNHALEESKMQNISETYTDWTRDLLHVNSLLEEQASLYKENNDTEAYRKATQMIVDNQQQIIEARQSSLNALQAQYDEGMRLGLLDPTMQRALLDEINTAEEEVQKLINDNLRKQREVDKIDLDAILTDQSWAASQYSHNQQLISYQSSKYQNAGELTNYGTMLEADISLREERIDAIKDEIDVLEQEREYYNEKYGPGTEEEKQITEQIMKREEELEKENTELAKNNKLLDENADKIRKVRKALEDTVDKQIEDEKKRQREILSANVSLQDTLLNLIKQRLQKEWNLKKKDIEKEKESLNEYKKLINERFNYRKKASEQADREEELAEYKHQLALIEADPTRTKDAKELRRKIADMEKENAWNLAEEELNAENERIDEQVTGMDKFVQYNEELLNEILGDANNFAVDLNNILTDSFEESYQNILEYMKKYNEAFIKSLPDVQQQMIQSWEDTAKKAYDIIDTNYAEITDILMSEETYLEKMRNSDEYRKAVEGNDENTMAILERQYKELYQSYIKSIKDDAEFEAHDHDLEEVESRVDDLEGSLYQVDTQAITGEPLYSPTFDNSGVTSQDFSNYMGLIIEDLDSIYKVIVPDETSTEAASTNDGKGTSTVGQLYHVMYNGKSVYASAKQQEAQGYLVSSRAVAVARYGVDKSEEAKASLASWQKAYVKRYKYGGLADYTGPAWVDGSKQRPEAFLNADDTQNMRAMLDAFNFIKTRPYMSHVDPSMYGNNTNIGDINITINQAELKSDADYDVVARKVGQAFSKQLSRQGLNLNGYAF